MNSTLRNIRIIVAFFFIVTSTVSGAEVLTVVSPDGLLPLVTAAEGKVHQDAAADLCEYLSRVTGREIKPNGAAQTDDASVTFHIGPDAFVLEHAPEVRDLYADGFVLKHIAVDGKHHLVLSGIRWKASRWAVEEFLKQFCGVRWLFPNDPVYGEIVPSRPTVVVDENLNQKHEPSYMDRSNLAMYFLDRHRAHLRLKASAGDYFGSHEFQRIFTREDYDAHPEWFALFTIPENWANSIVHQKWPAASDSVINALARGERRQRWHWDHGSDWQICTSNPATVQHAVEYAHKYFAENPDSPAVSMGHNDNSGWCECENCAAFANTVVPSYTISERYWHWVNQVAKELAKTHPDKLIATLAYAEPANPPRFELEKNISVMITVYVEGHLDLVKQWQKKCDSLNLYSYAFGFFFVGFRHYPHAMRDFLKWGHDELGAVGHVSECSGVWSFDGPKYHYMQALMWDVNADPDKVMDEYCHDWFGAGARPMRGFWDRHEAIYERRGTSRRLLFYQWVGFSPHYDEFDHYTLDDVRVLDESIAEAERAADTDADRFRVACVADAWRYLRALLLGKLRFADHQEQVLKDAASSTDRAIELALELADLQSQKNSHLKQLRAFAHINPHIASDAYYSTFSRIPIFADMRTILDLLCERVTSAMDKSVAEAFWKQIKPDDPLYESAATQLYLLAHPERTNALTNGDFEGGDLAGWESSGEVAITNTASRSGHGAAEGKGTLSQIVALKPGERYKLTAWGKYSAAPLPNAVLLPIDVSFQAGIKDIYPEITYRRLRKSEAAGDWTAIHATFTVPPDGDTAVISLNPTRSSEIPVIWDDVTLEKILEPE